MKILTFWISSLLLAPATLYASPSIDLGRVGKVRNVWPSTAGFTKTMLPQDVKISPQCQDFVSFATGQRTLTNGFMTDQLLVIKNGQSYFEWYDRPAYSSSNQHFLWSASKTVTSTIIAAAIAKGALTPKGEPLTLETPLTDFFSAEERMDKLKKKYGCVGVRFLKNNCHKLNLKKEAEFKNIKIKHFISMATGFKWEESYESDPDNSSFLPMLYGDGRFNMAEFALLAPMELAPGKRWNYSGGNSVILMSVLAKLKVNGFGGNLQEYQQMPNRLLFDRIGMKSAFYERDKSGTFVGSSYAHMTPEDMARFGYLYLNGGYWNGERILPEGWVYKSQQPTQAIVEPGNTTPIELIRREGVFSDGSFWLNQGINGNWMDNGSKVTRFENEFKNSPKDMFFAAGHYGQLIIVLPTQDMVIVRTGSDKEYWSKIDSFVSKAVKCFEKVGESNAEFVYEK